MREIPVEEVRPGDVLARTLVDNRGRQILPAGAKLTQAVIARLPGWGYLKIAVTEAQPSPRTGQSTPQPVREPPPGGASVPETSLRIYHFSSMGPLGGNPEDRPEYAIPLENGAAEDVALYAPVSKTSMLADGLLSSPGNGADTRTMARLRMFSRGPALGRGQGVDADPVPWLCYGLNEWEASAIQRTIEGRTSSLPPWPLDVDKAKAQGRIGAGVYVLLHEARLYVPEETRLSAAHAEAMARLKPFATYI